MPIAISRAVGRILAAGVIVVLLAPAATEAATFELKKLDAPDIGADTTQAQSILDLVFQCVGRTKKSGTKTVTDTFVWKGDENFFVVEDTVAELEIDQAVNRATARPDTIVSDETSWIVRTTANFAKLGIASERDGGLMLTCTAGERCFALEREFGGNCGVTLSDDRVCGNVSADMALPPPRSVRAMYITNMCSDQIGNAVTALTNLIASARARATETAPDLYEVSGLPLEYTIPVREAPNADSLAVSQIPSASGPVPLSECKPVAGYQNPWCRTRIGVLEGWVSRTRFAPYLP